MSIYFKPTYVYLKQHSITGKLYFGITTQNVESYIGSGTRWLKHINHHGRTHVVTLWYCLFLDLDSLCEFTLMYSSLNKIVESEDYLNLMIENGLGGLPSGEHHPFYGKNFTQEHKDNLNKTKIGRKHSEDRKAKITASLYARVLTPEAKLRMNHSGMKASDETKAKMKAIIVCPHCGKSGGNQAMHRWHFDNCKLKS